MIQKQKMNSSNLSSGFNVRKTAIIIAVVLIVVYGMFNARNIIIGPEIEIISPNPESETTENLVIIRGVAKNVTFLSLNNRAIFMDQEGNFKEKLLLSPGFNIISLYGRDRFKQGVTEEFKIYYKQSNLEELTQ